MQLSAHYFDQIIPLPVLYFVLKVVFISNITQLNNCTLNVLFISAVPANKDLELKKLKQSKNSLNTFIYCKMSSA